MRPHYNRYRAAVRPATKLGKPAPFWGRLPVGALVPMSRGRILCVRYKPRLHPVPCAGIALLFKHPLRPDLPLSRTPAKSRGYRGGGSARAKLRHAHGLSLYGFGIKRTPGLATSATLRRIGGAKLHFATRQAPPGAIRRKESPEQHRALAGKQSFHVVQSAFPKALAEAFAKSRIWIVSPAGMPGASSTRRQSLWMDGRARHRIDGIGARRVRTGRRRRDGVGEAAEWGLADRSRSSHRASDHRIPRLAVRASRPALRRVRPDCRRFQLHVVTAVRFEVHLVSFRKHDLSPPRLAGRALCLRIGAQNVNCE